MRNTYSIVGLLLVAIFTVPAHAVAPPYLSVGVDINNIANDLLGENNLPSISETNHVSMGSSVASGNASADIFGTFKVDASAATSGISSIVIASVASRADTFHILPPAGTTSSFLATLQWSGSSSGSCGSTSAAFCTVNETDSLLSDSSYPATIHNDFFYDSTSPSANIPPNGMHQVQQIWIFPGPNLFSLAEQLILGITVRSNVPGATASFAGDLGHTGHFYLDPITPGATYTTASSNLYLTPSAPVPEPVSWVMLSAGLLVVGTITKKTRKNT